MTAVALGGMVFLTAPAKKISPSWLAISAREAPSPSTAWPSEAGATESRSRPAGGTGQVSGGCLRPPYVLSHARRPIMLFPTVRSQLRTVLQQGGRRAGTGLQGPLPLACCPRPHEPSAPLGAVKDHVEERRAEIWPGKQDLYVYAASKSAFLAKGLLPIST